MQYVLEIKRDNQKWEPVNTFEEPEEAITAANILHRARHHQTHLISEPKPLKWGEQVGGQTTARMDYIKHLFDATCETISYRISGGGYGL